MMKEFLKAWKVCELEILETQSSQGLSMRLILVRGPWHVVIMETIEDPEIRYVQNIYTCMYIGHNYLDRDNIALG